LSEELLAKPWEVETMEVFSVGDEVGRIVGMIPGEEQSVLEKA
jgi:hypothetical protein